MDDSLISVIVPVYKAQDYIAQCVQSILRQSYGHFELLLIVDGSPDDSAAICRSFAQRDDRITVIEKPNEGVSATRNLGIQLAKGEYIAFIDSDDTVEETYLEELLQAAKAEDAEYAMCGICFWSGDGLQPFPEMQLQGYRAGCDDLYDRYIKGMFRIHRKPYLMGAAVRSLINRQFLTEHQISFPNCKISEDQLFVLEVLAKVNRVAVVSKPMYYYNSDVAESAMRTLRKQNYLADQTVYWQELQQRIQALPIAGEDKKCVYFYGTLDARKRVMTNLAMCPDKAERNEELREIRRSPLFAQRIPAMVYLQWLAAQPVKTIFAELLLRLRLYGLLRKLRGG